MSSLRTRGGGGGLEHKSLSRTQKGFALEPGIRDLRDRQR